jgi:hypothetical protein
VVLQQPSVRSAPVTPTPYLSLRALGSILRLTDPEELRQMALVHGLEQRETRRIELKQGKSFYLGRYSLMGAC